MTNTSLFKTLSSIVLTLFLLALLPLASFLVPIGDVQAEHEKPLTTQPTGEGQCESGYSLNAAKTACELTITHTDSDGACPAKYDEVQGKCVLLRTLVAACAQDGSEIYDADLDKCVPNENPDKNCEDNEIFDENLQRCVPSEVGGDDGNGGSGTTQNTFKIENPLQSEDLGDLINSIINVLLLLAAPITVIMVVYAGFLYVVSAGKEDKIKTANKTIAFAAIGFAVLLISKSVVVVINDVLNSGAPQTETSEEDEGGGLPTDDEDGGENEVSLAITEMLVASGNLLNLPASVLIHLKDDPGAVVDYTLDWGDGGSNEGSVLIGDDGTVEFEDANYYEPGTYTITLTVTNKATGESTKKTSTVVIE